MLRVSELKRKQKNKEEKKSEDIITAQDQQNAEVAAEFVAEIAAKVAVKVAAEVAAEVESEGDANVMKGSFNEKFLKDGTD